MHWGDDGYVKMAVEHGAGAVLGGLLLHAAGYWEIGDVVSEQDFYRGDHRLIWRTIARLLEDDASVDVLTVGRALENDLPLPLDQVVSGRHARLVREGRHYWLEDLGSRNGTNVNDQKVSDQVLSSGDVIKVGAHEFRYRVVKKPANSELMRTRLDSPRTAPSAPSGGAAASSEWVKTIVETIDQLPEDVSLEGAVTRRKK